MQLFLLFILLFTNTYAVPLTENQLRQEFYLNKEAYSYLEEALSYMEEGSVNTSILDWDTVKMEVYRKATNAMTAKDTYEAIDLALSLLKDNHSFFLRPTQVKYLENRNNDQSVSVIQSNSKIIDNEIAYLLIPSCHSLSENQLRQYGLSIRQEIQTLDKEKLGKWIIDLRGNSGGNMWPMVLGLRPLIIGNIFGFFSNGLGESYAWNLEDLPEIYSLNTPSYCLSQPDPRIAVLVDKETGSSGEAVAVAFLGQDQTKLFGQKTGGYTSANEAISLSDGAIILLATTYLADRLGRIYKDGITPDQITEAGDSTLYEAIQWLKEEGN